MKSYALYIHIPFCAKKCNYCNFTSYANKENLIPSYIEAIGKEMAFYSEALGSALIKTIYLGGGTPSILEFEDIEKIIKDIQNYFVISDDYEATIEANPGTLNLIKLIQFKNLGLNRLSIGAQSFNDEHLKFLGRIHTASQIHYTIATARKAGFDNINLDLIFSIPNQSLEDWRNTLKRAVSLEPEHISTYSLSIEPDTPLYMERDNLAFPSEDTDYAMFDLAINILEREGYKHYEISNFAIEGFECRNNLTYWENDEYIGIGCGAASYIGKSRYSNTKNIKEYINNWEEGKGRSIPITPQRKKEEIAETIFLGLRKTDGINISETNKRLGIDILRYFRKEIEEFIKFGLLSVRDQRLMLTKRGLFLADEVFERFV